MGLKGFFLDTYAMVEIIKGNKDYSIFIDKELFTSVFHLYELYYTILREYGQDMAEHFFFKFKNNLLGFKDNEIFSASKFKLANIKRRISYSDAIGYIIAKENELKFLTGDKEFKDMDNVEFVK